MGVMFGLAILVDQLLGAGWLSITLAASGIAGAVWAGAQGSDLILKKTFPWVGTRKTDNPESEDKNVSK